METYNYVELYDRYREIEKHCKLRKEHIWNELKRLRNESQQVIIVLDDDPTGAQAVHDIAVYTSWSEDSIDAGFHEPNGVFYILTNSRAFTQEQTLNIHKEIARNISKVAARVQKKFVIISRGDSTLRGHYPLETIALKEGLEHGSSMALNYDGEILVPFFGAGGRVTVNDIHYVLEGETLIPVADTEFAKDKTFGYLHSNLCEYIEEKTMGNVKKTEVVSIPLDKLRSGKVDEIVELLITCTGYQRVVVNALELIDVQVFCLALYHAWNRGKHFMIRCAADFIRSIVANDPIPLLQKEQILNQDNTKGGLVIVGSHTQKTTEQLNKLRERSDLLFLEFDSDLVLSDQLLEEVDRIVSIIEEHLLEGKSVVIYTKRTLLSVADDTKEQALLRSVKISEAVQQLVCRLSIAPAFIIAKGGITSSDIGVKALNVKRAVVLGQIQPGILVWRTGEESRFPGIPFIIFPGNVGKEDSLKIVVDVLLEEKI